jgi:hypothetical protein
VNKFNSLRQKSHKIIIALILQDSSCNSLIGGSSRHENPKIESSHKSKRHTEGEVR